MKRIIKINLVRLFNDYNAKLIFINNYNTSKNKEEYNNILHDSMKNKDKIIA